MAVVDCARFLVEDPAELVAAPFACPWCPTWPPDTVPDVGPRDSTAHCVCPACASGWDVALHAGQALRLRLAPPASLRVHDGRSAGP